MKKYTSSLDQTAKVTPYAILVLGFIILVAGLFVFIKYSDQQLLLYITTLPTFFLLIGIVVAMYYLQPLGVTLNDGDIIIDRRIKPVVIPIAEIKQVRAVSEDDMRYSIKTMGNGGVFGYTGAYYNKKMGKMSWYCSQRKNYILIERTNNKKVIVTPDDPEALLRDVKKMHPSLIAKN